jgi:predicted aspartyl protease
MKTTIKPKGTEMGRVLTAIKVENLEDLFAVKRGLIQPADVRSVQVKEALVDTGATILSLPTRVIKELGLDFKYTRHSETPVGLRKVKVYSPVRLSVQDRECMVDVAELTNHRAPALVGQIPLELMDFVVDPRQGKIIPNPAHGGKWMMELY